MAVDSMISTTHLSAIEKLGTRLDETFTAEQAMQAGKLGGWNVRRLPLLTLTEDGQTLPVAGKSSIVRNNPDVPGQVDVLGVASDGYTPIQNEEHAELLNALVEESGANFELAGSLDGGRKTFISMRLPGHINVGGVDPVGNSLIALNSHDGSMSFTVMIAPVRYACANVLNIPYKGMSNIIRVRHTSGAQKNLHRWAREALDIGFNYLDGFQEQAEELIQKTMTQTQFEEIIFNEFGGGFGHHRGNRDAASEATKTRADQVIEQMSELFADANTQEGIRGTAWAGFNALTEWADHFAPTRGEDRETARSTKALLYPNFKREALELMLNA